MGYVRLAQEHIRLPLRRGACLLAACSVFPLQQWLSQAVAIAAATVPCLTLVVAPLQRVLEGSTVRDKHKITTVKAATLGQTLGVCVREGGKRDGRWWLRGEVERRGGATFYIDDCFFSSLRIGAPIPEP